MGFLVVHRYRFWFAVYSSQASGFRGVVVHVVNVVFETEGAQGVLVGLDVIDALELEGLFVHGDAICVKFDYVLGFEQLGELVEPDI
jgi:hypothetical protein